MFDRTPIDYEKIEQVVTALEKSGLLLDKKLIITRYGELMVDLGVTRVDKEDFRSYSKFPYFQGFVPNVNSNEKDGHVVPFNYVLFDVSKKEK